MNDSGGDGERRPLGGFFERFEHASPPIDRTETLPVSTAVGRVLADPVVARRPVPHYDQVTRDGFAVAAAELADASDDAPVSLVPGERAANGRAVRVDAGEPLPPGADAVLALDAVGDYESELSEGSERDDAAVPELDCTDAVAPGTGVRHAGADVSDGETVRAAGHRLTESDPALCTVIGRSRVEVYQRPTVGVVPTGRGLVGGDAGPETVVETNGTTISAFVERWGGKVTYRDPVATDRHALRPAVERDLTKDLIVTVGGTGDGEADRIGDVLAALGDVLVDGVALEPCTSVTLSVVRERPVLSVPGDPVDAFVATALLLGPAVTRLAGRDTPAPDSFDAELSERIASESGLVSAVPVTTSGRQDPSAADRFRNERVAPDDADAVQTVRPVADDPFSTLARADGWVVVPPARDHVAPGERVTVERWEASS